MKIKILNGAKIILEILIYVLLLINIFKSSNYDNFNFFQKIFYAPFFESTYIFNKIFDFRIAYFMTILLSFVLIYPIFSSFFIYFRKTINLWKKLNVLHHQEVKTDEEQKEKVLKMIDELDESGFSLTKTVMIIFMFIMGTYALRFMFSGAFSSDIYNVVSYDVLWLTLNKPDPSLSLFGFSIFFLYAYPLYNYVIKITREKNKEEQVKLNFNILMTLSFSTILIYLCYLNVMFALFIILTKSKNLFKTLRSDSNARIIKRN